jgi:hypothetical protein
LPACLSAQGPSLSIPDRDAFQLRLTPFNSTPTFARPRAEDYDGAERTRVFCAQREALWHAGDHDPIPEDTGETEPKPASLGLDSLSFLSLLHPALGFNDAALDRRASGLTTDRGLFEPTPRRAQR